MSTAYPSIIFLVVFGVSAVLLLRRSPDGYVTAFAEAYQVDLTPTNAAHLRATIQRGRAIRFTGAAIVTTGYMLWRGELSFWGFWGAVAVGFGLGSIIDELQRPIQRTGNVVAASLQQRTLRTYVTRWAIGGACVMLVLVGVQAWTLYQLDPAGTPLPDTRWVGARLAAVVFATLCGALAIHRIVQAPTIADRHDLQAARHAIRMAGVMSVLGAIYVIAAAVVLSLVEITALHDNGLPKWWQWVNNLTMAAAVIGFYNGMTLSLYAFPRPPWFRKPAALRFAPDTAA